MAGPLADRGRFASHRFRDHSFDVPLNPSLSEQVQLAESASEDVVRTAVDPIVVINDHGIILQANEATTELFGYGLDELIGRSVTILMGEPERSAHDGYLADYRRTGIRSIIGIGRDVRGATKTGRPVDLHLSVSELSVGGTTLFAGIMRDIRDRKALEVELEQANALLAAELATAKAELDVLSDRDRIARGLHDTVIQQLFAAGLGLNAAASLTADDEVVDRLSAAITQVDEAIYQLRSTVYDLHTRARPTGLKRAVLGVVAEQRPALGFEPEVKVGVNIAEVSDRVIDQLLPTLREALSNVAQHARARSAQVAVLLEDGDLVLRLSDDGRGIELVATDGGPAQPLRGNGLHNMGERAASLGGTCTVRSLPTGGTELEWRVPLSLP